MWEDLVRAPLGRITPRKFVTMLATILVAAFVYLVANAPATLALDANWQDGKLSYEGKTYSGPEIASADNGLGIEADSTYYTYTPGTGSNRSDKDRTVLVIYFSPGVDPPAATSATRTSYTYNTDTKQYSKPTNVETITITPDSNSEPATSPGTTSCVVDGIGWIICPVTTFLASGMDYIFELIDGFLEVRPLSTDTNQAMYRAWSWSRDIANVLFVIGFLFLVYGQVTGGIISNYTIKRMMPRVIVAAVLVNVSYWICAILVDLFNIFGYGAQSLFIEARNTLVGSEGNSWDVVSWERFADLILSGGAVLGGGSIAAYLGITAATGAVAGTVGIGGAIGGLIMLILPVLVALLFVVMVVFLILAARQAMITILIVIAPLAFVAYLLPNTEKWFERWQKTFINLLFMFPAFSVIFGGSQLASAIIIQNANSLGIILLAMIVQLAPLAITPLLLKLGGGVMSRIGGMINSPTKGAFDRGKVWAKDRSAQNQARGMAALAQRSKAMGYSGKRPTSDKRGLRGRAVNARMRLNPYNMTYAREYSRRQREGMKAQNEAMTEGLFTQTAAGRQIYHRGQEAGYEKHYGEALNKESWTNRVHGNPVTGTPGDHYLHSLHHDAHMAEGRAKIIEEAANAHSERALQEYVRDTKAYRDLRVKATVETGLADSAKKVVDAQGTLALKKSIKENPDLTEQAIQTVKFEKQAAQYDTIVQKSAEEAYDIYSRTNSTAQKLRLEAVEQTDRASLAEKQWNTIIEEARAKGYNSPSISSTASVTADNLQYLQRQLAAEDKRVENAQFAQRRNIVEAYTADAALRLYAGGVEGQKGATRIQAQATKEFVDESVKAVMTNRSLTSQLTREQLKTMLYDGKDQDGNKVTTEMQQAAMYELLQEKGNNMDAQEIRDAITQKGFAFDETDNKFYEYERDSSGRIRRDAKGWPIVDKTKEVAASEAGDRRDWQQFFEDAAKGSGHNISTLSGTNKSQSKAGNLVDDTRYGFIRDALTGKFGPEKILKADIDELKIIIEDMQDPAGEYQRLGTEDRAKYATALENAIISLQSHPTYRGQIDDRNRGIMNDILVHVKPEYSTGLTDANGMPIFNVRKDNSIVPANSPEAEKQFVAPVIHSYTPGGSRAFNQREITDI